MKKNCAGVIVCMFMLMTGVSAQNTITKIKSMVEPLRLAISSDKTTNLIFPYAIKSIDRGSKDVLVQKAKGVENILQVKAAQENLKETNLTAITSDGGLYSFVLYYSNQPSFLNLNLALSDIPISRWAYWNPTMTMRQKHRLWQKGSRAACLLSAGSKIRIMISGLQ